MEYAAPIDREAVSEGEASSRPQFSVHNSGTTAMVASTFPEMNADSSPQLHAVMEVPFEEDSEWISLPPKPWPRYIRLWRETPPEAVAVVVCVVSWWGAESKASSAEALVKDFPRGLPGGFAAVDQEQVIGPSCCCGLEGWKEWLDILTTGQSPWMGHDPAPFVEVQGEQVCVWADGGLGGKHRGGSPVVFSKREFEKAVHEAARDLSEFEIPLRQWLNVHAPEHVDSLAAEFRESFISCTRST